MNVLVTGACGQLGSELRLLAKGRRDRYVFTDVASVPEEGIGGLDITDAGAVRDKVKKEGIQVIVNCAAYTDVEAAEDNAALAERINGEAPGILAAAMKEAGGLLVHISTDYVFGGEPVDAPIREDHPAAPLGVYGLSKLHGEQAVQESGCRHIIIRTGWLYSESGKNFVRTMLRLMDTRPQLKVVSDQVGTPTYAVDLAGAIMTILDSTVPAEGIYHYTDEGVCSWYDFAKAIADYSGHTACDIIPCHSDEFPTKARRPAYSVLDKTKIKETFGLAIPHWTDSLRRCLAKMINENR
ncbi:MAG: dTDP-4-dehydrorhamnose reductase [Bacteroidales bacterium]|nr:dTDP-4-dehydrorhamnose reductase [Bacteroidales bacterium]